LQVYFLDPCPVVKMHVDFSCIDLRRIFGQKRDDVTGGWRKLHSEEFHNLYSSPSTIRMIKSRKMNWAGHVA
jgi:hypothetical protein